MGCKPVVGRSQEFAVQDDVPLAVLWRETRLSPFTRPSDHFDLDDICGMGAGQGAGEKAK